MRVQLIFSHCDDELLFGWPILLDTTYERELVICSSDENNKERAWCSKRKLALARVCQLLDIPFQIFPHPSEFFRLPNRPPASEIFKVQDDVRAAMAASFADVVFTHNPHGEYGHTDHRMIHKMVTEFTQKPVWFTDIWQWANWPLGPQRFAVNARHGYHDAMFLFSATMTPEQLETYRRCEKIYNDFGCWTWSHDVIQSCKVYQQ